MISTKHHMTQYEFVAWRQRHKLRWKDAAATLGKHWQTIARYESGRSPIPNSIAKLCDAVDRERGRALV